MKKLALVVLLGLVIATTGVFANHPGGWALGLGAQYGAGWDAPTSGGARWALYFKAPQLPVYWSGILDLKGGTGYSAFGLSINGDYYAIDRALIPQIGLGWFLGLGGYLRFYNHSADAARSSYFGIGAGARVPVGISWRPLNFLEFFMDIAPSLGFQANFGDGISKKFEFPAGGWQGDIAVRLWL
jgi:hypothetical protein